MRTTLLRVAALAVLACACESTPGGKEPGKKPAVVPIAELPERQRQVLTDYGRGGAVWDARREEVLADPALARFLVDNLVLELVRAYQGLTAPDPRRAQAAFERARAELVRAEEHALPVLVQLLDTGDSVVAHVAGDVLTRIGKPSNDLLLPLLESPRHQVRQRAAAVLGTLPAAGAGEERVRASLAQRMSKDPEWMVRAQAAAAMGERGARDRETGPWRLALEPGLRDEDPLVVEGAVNALLKLGDVAAVPALIDALERAVTAGNLPAVTTAQQALAGLTGQRRDLELQAWKGWWQANRTRIEGSRGTPAGGAPR